MSKRKKTSKIKLLPPPKKSWCRRTVHDFSEAVDDESLAVGFFVVRRDRTVRTGWSNDHGASDTDLIGGIEIMKQTMIDDLKNG